MPFLTDCTATLGTYTYAGCGPEPLAGGIRYIVIGVSDIEDTITDPTVALEWQTAIDAGDVFIIPVLAQKAETNKTREFLTSCAPERVTNREHVITFREYNTGNDNTDFWNTIEDASTSLKFGYIDCAWNFYGWIEDGAFDVDRIIEENSKEGKQYWSGQLAWSNKEHIIPVVMDYANITFPAP